MSTPAKRTPDGFIAQRFGGRDIQWAALSLGEHGLDIQTYTDEQVADWPDHHEVELLRAQVAALTSTIRSVLDTAEAVLVPHPYVPPPPPCAGCSSPLCPDCSHGAGTAEVWIPPASDCMEHRHDKPCPHCGSELYHHRTRRCAGCGRRP